MPSLLGVAIACGVLVLGCVGLRLWWRRAVRRAFEAPLTAGQVAGEDEYETLAAMMADVHRRVARGVVEAQGLNPDEVSFEFLRTPFDVATLEALSKVEQHATTDPKQAQASAEAEAVLRLLRKMLPDA